MATISITVSGMYLQVAQSLPPAPDVIYTMPKGDVFITRIGDRFSLSRSTGKVLDFDYSEVTAPVTANAGSLEATLRTMTSDFGGIAEDIAALPTFAVGEVLAPRMNKEDGSMFVHQKNLTKDTDEVSSYRGNSVRAAYNVLLAASASDVVTITGSATKVVRVRRILVSGTATSTSIIPITLKVRSTANTAGTSTVVSAVKHDSADPAATATMLAYTANPNAGNLIGTIRSVDMPFPVATGANSNWLAFDFGAQGQKDLTLRGTDELVAVNLSAQTVTGGKLNVSIEWTEEDA